MPEEQDIPIALNPDQMARAQAAALARELVIEKGAGFASKGETVDHEALIEVAHWIMTGECFEEEDVDEAVDPVAVPTAPRYPWTMNLGTNPAGPGPQFADGGSTTFEVRTLIPPAMYEDDEDDADEDDEAPDDTEATSPSNFPLR